MNDGLSNVVHIYQLSRLVHVPPPRWERLLERLEEDRDRAFNYYQPVREASVKLCECGGKHRDRILSRLIADSRAVVHTPRQDPVTDNAKAFTVFEDNFYPKLKFVKSLLRTPQGDGIPWQGLKLKGMPHFVAEDPKGRTRYAMLYPSKWEIPELKAYLYLLSVIVAHVFSGQADSIWCMDLRTAAPISCRFGPRIRDNCQDAARHYERLTRA